MKLDTKNEMDALINDATRLLERIDPGGDIEYGVSLFQRQLRLSYVKAATLRDEMDDRKLIVSNGHKFKYVGPPKTSIVECWFCNARALMARITKDIDELGEIYVPLYDDPLTEIYNQADSASSLLRCYCNEVNDE